MDLEKIKEWKKNHKKIIISRKLWERINAKKIGTWEQFLTRLFCFWEMRGSP